MAYRGLNRIRNICQLVCATPNIYVCVCVYNSRVDIRCTRCTRCKMFLFFLFFLNAAFITKPVQVTFCLCCMLGNTVFFSMQAEEARRLEEQMKNEMIQSVLPENTAPDSIVPESSPLENGPPESPVAEKSLAEQVFDEVFEGETNQASQVEEILRLEREIEGLRRQKEAQEQSLTTQSLHRLQWLRDQELRRLEEEACKAAQQFLTSLNFDEIDECVRNIESSLGGSSGSQQGVARGEEDEVDEGLGVDDGFKDSPNPSEHGHSDGQRTSGIRTSDDSSEEDPYANDRMPLPPALPIIIPSAFNAPPSSSGSTYSQAVQEEEAELIPPDEDSDYDADDYDGGMIMRPPSLPPHNDYWSHDHRSSMATSTSVSSGAYRFSSDGPQSSVSFSHIFCMVDESDSLKDSGFL